MAVRDSGSVLLAGVLRRLLREERRPVSPLATELANALRNLRRQWLPNDDEKEALLRPWRLLVSFFGSSAFFLLFGLMEIRRNVDHTAPSRWKPNVEQFIGPLSGDIQFALWALPALPFAILIFFQKGRAGPVSVFLGGVALPALTFWIVRTSTGDYG